MNAGVEVFLRERRFAARSVLFVGSSPLELLEAPDKQPHGRKQRITEHGDPFAKRQFSGFEFRTYAHRVAPAFSSVDDDEPAGKHHREQDKQFAND